MSDQCKKNLSQSYYLKPVKIIRDLVHGYINLTRFDLKLIDTVQFQRLSDIRQLTCQHVYPAARHTRFEHSLGVRELMGNAIKHLNKNGVIGESPKPNAEPIISKTLEFNAYVAALLHDIGHCPFSHMGETQFDKEIVRETLIDEIKEHEQLKNCCDLIDRLEKGQGIGAVHEQLSCIMILRKYIDRLSNLTETADNEEDCCEIEADFELIIRSILGIEYDVSNIENFHKHKVKNLIVRLLNSTIIDVDKLDYIMRDSHLTGIGTPEIDTQRLFRNMYLDKNYSLVFTSRAVPALQNMIDARDGLYLYVYNHHAVVYSDFLNTYISRRLSHNTKAFYSTVYPTMNTEEVESVMQAAPISSLGIIPKSYLFSVDAVVEDHHADSAWLSLLNIIHINYLEILKMVECSTDVDDIPEAFQEKILCQIQLNLRWELEGLESVPFDGSPGDHEPLRKLALEVERNLAQRIFNSMQLVHQSMRRYYLKPWWKTVFEFSNFMHYYFRDDRIRNQVGNFICNGGSYQMKADEFRSQIAKHVIYITQKLVADKKAQQFGLLEALNDGDFFVIQRSPRFFLPNVIEKIEIALKSNEILGPPADVNRQLNEYFIKTLTNIIPQKNYSSIYAEDGFYIFSKQISNEKQVEEEAKSRHYKLLEHIFAFVVKEFIDCGEQQFIAVFHNSKTPNEDAKEASKMAMYQKFISQKA